MLKSKFSFVFSVLAAFLLLSPSAFAENNKIDKRLLSPLPMVQAAISKSGGAIPVTLRASGELSKGQIAKLEEVGFDPLYVNGKALHIGLIYSGKSSRNKLDAIADFDFVERIEFAISKATRPMDQARVANGIDKAYTDYTDGEGNPITGVGQVICIDDSKVDIFHPAFFKPSDETFDWIDANENGKFDTSIDSVDMNSNGVADVGESLAFFDAHLNYDYYAPAQNKDNVFQVDLDYLYNDENSSGERDYGISSGFVESDPCYGERLFFVNDTNGNNQLDPGETLTGLGESKVQRAYIVGSQYNVVEYTRGEDLIEYPFSSSDYVSHGTGTSGVSASGWYPHRLRGVAYEAELVLVESSINYYVGTSQEDYLNMSAGLGLCKEAGARVTLHEYCVSTTHPRDGSSNDAEAITEAEKSGMLPICPSCNYKGGKKHSYFRVPPKETLERKVYTDPVYPQYDGSYRQMMIGLTWRQPDRDVQIELKKTDGTWIDLGNEMEWGAYTSNLTWVSIRETTERGTVHNQVMLYGSDYGDLLSPPYYLRFTNNGGTPLDITAVVTDDQSSFAYGLIWEKDSADGYEENKNITTTTLPAGADGGTGIGAHEHRDGHNGLASYSSGGLRIDGRMTIHVTGTYAQMTPGAQSDSPQDVYDSYEHGNFIMFGGTSSSSPLMAGVTALVTQYAPDIDGPGLRKALMLSSDSSLAVSSPDTYWGWGKVNVPDLLEATASAMTDDSLPVPSIFSYNVGVMNEAMVFSGAGSLDDRENLLWSWSTDDANNVDEDTDKMWFLHTFTKPGTYSVTLIVTDEKGNKVPVNKSVEIIGLFDTYDPQTPAGSYGPCNLWESDRCKAYYAVSCFEGTWEANDCRAFCEESGLSGGSCLMNGETAECKCSDDPIDGDENPEDGDQEVEEDGDEIEPDGDENPEDGDQAEDGDSSSEDGDNNDDDDDDDSDVGSGNGGDGCNGTGSNEFPLFLMAIALLALNRKRYLL